MSAVGYVTGAVFLLVVAAAFALAGDALRGRLLPEARGPLRVVVTSVLATGVLLAVLHLLGALGWFRFAPVLVAALVVGITGFHRLA
jgi:hypothetical protein